MPQTIIEDIPISVKVNFLDVQKGYPQNLKCRRQRKGLRRSFVRGFNAALGKGKADLVILDRCNKNMIS
jgi:hypothetical protein